MPKNQYIDPKSPKDYKYIIHFLQVNRYNKIDAISVYPFNDFCRKIRETGFISNNVCVPYHAIYFIEVYSEE